MRAGNRLPERFSERKARKKVPLNDDVDHVHNFKLTIFLYTSRQNKVMALTIQISTENLYHIIDRGW